MLGKAVSSSGLLGYISADITAGTAKLLWQFFILVLLVLFIDNIIFTICSSAAFFAVGCLGYHSLILLNSGDFCESHSSIAYPYANYL